MSEKRWTQEQSDFITAPRGPILVSAAAGSGKTASVVERVITRLCDRQNPLKASRLLMTTFSNAAANEMLSRIEAAIDKRIEEEGEDEFLLTQAEELASAQISTIHAFCLKVIRENFAQLNLFCDFRVVDETENEILMYSALKKVVSKAYEENLGDFYKLIELVCTSRNDSELLEVILKLYRTLIAMPFYEDTVENWLSLAAPSDESYDKWMGILVSEAQKSVAFALSLAKANLENFAQMSGLECLVEDNEKLEQLYKLLDSKNYEQAYSYSQQIIFDNRRLPRKIEPETREMLKNTRTAMKDAVSKCSDILDYSWKSEFVKDQNELLGPVECLFSLVLNFINEFAAQKREKNVVDFSDAEQFMLSLLWKKDENGNYQKTEIAQHLQNRFDEIYIDEYQDVNAAQEMIFKAIEPKSQNVFMVGDVKQSIYGFRQADSDIFEGKKEKFFDYNAKNFPAKIFFDKNFRSRSEITEFINKIFKKIMTVDTCNAVYEDKDALKAGATYAEAQNVGAEILLYECAPKTREKQWLEDEAKIIANEIKRLVDSGYRVADGEGTRPCQYRDFCILSRSDGGRFTAYAEALSALDIDFTVDKSGEDFLQSREMLMICAILKAIHNPFDDVSLCAAMISPVFLFTPAQLASIRGGKNKKRQSLFASVKEQAQNGDEACAKFIEKLRSLQRKASANSVDALISHVYNEYGLYNMLGALNGGEIRQNNLDVFRYYARTFEKNGYKGLGEFLRFIDKTREQKKKLKGADSKNEGYNSVTIMTIHKSKGLEYPICILANSAKAFNRMDTNSSTLVNKEFGFATMIKSDKLSVRYAPLSYKAIRLAQEIRDTAEEMRVLYVALTRAKEKLIIPIVRANMDKYLSAICVKASASDLSYGVSDGKSYAEWMLLSGYNAVCQTKGADCEPSLNEAANAMGCKLTYVEYFDDADETSEIERVESSPELIKKLYTLSRYQYPFAEESQIVGHYSVSELTKGEKQDAFDFEKRPDFMSQDKMTGAERGTALHTFMQFADFERARENLENELSSVCDKGFITPKQLSVINKDRLSVFFSSKLCDRILSADKILREYKFTSSMPATAFGGNRNSDSVVLIQGIADMVIIEGDSATIIDYKTDRVDSANELYERYCAQLSIYAEAIEKLLNVKIKECIIYSFCLNGEISFSPEPYSL